LGDRIDGWAELVDGKANQADALYRFLHHRLARRGMPNVSHGDTLLTPGGLAGEKRRYHLVVHKVGTSVAVRIGSFGKDLYVAWDLFVQQVWKWGVLMIIAGVAGLIAFAWEMSDYSPSPAAFFFKAGGLFTLFLPLVLLGGKLLKGSWLAYFREEYNQFSADDVTAMTLAVHNSLLEGLDHIGVNMSLVRSKREFRGGERDRII
jgi:hypothetical protein